MTRAQMEARRLQAIPAIDEWKEPGQLARELKVSRTTLYRWKLARQAGSDLKAKCAPGRPPRMTESQTARVVEIFYDSPWPEKWTQKKFADAIERKIGIKFQQDHVGRIMHRLGLRPKRERKSL